MLIVPSLIHVAKICEKHLIAEDPYQWESCSTDQLVSWFWILKNQRNKVDESLINEIHIRLQNPGLPDDERILLTKTLERK